MAESKTRIFYVLSFLGSLQGNIVAPLFIVFGLSLGLNIAQVGLLFGASRLSQFIFEIPTGIFADSYGRKKSILVCYFLCIFYSLFYFFSSNFYVLLAGSIISGLSLAFISGAFEALAVDSLGVSDQEQPRNRIFIRIGVITTFGFIAGGFFGSGIAYLNLRYIWIVQAIIAIFALILGWKWLEEKFYHEEKLNSQKMAIKEVFDKIKNPTMLIIKDKSIFFMFLVAILITLASAFYLVSWPIILKEILAIPVYYFGIISGIAGVFFLAGSLLAERWSFKKGTINTILLSLISMAIFYIIFSISRNIYLSLASFVLIDFFNGGFSPLFYSFINSLIPSPQRATILSIYSLAGGGASGMGEIIAGNLLRFFMPAIVVLLSPLLIIIASALFFIAKIKSAAKI